MTRHSSSFSASAALLLAVALSAVLCLTWGCGSGGPGDWSQGSPQAGASQGKSTAATPELSMRGAQAVMSEIPSTDYSVIFKVTSDWGSGFTGEVTIKNLGKTRISNWRLACTFDRSIDSIWCAGIVSRSGSSYVLKGESWNSWIDAGKSVSFGFNGSPGRVTSKPENCRLTGEVPSPAPTATPTATTTATPTATPTVTPAPSPTPTSSSSPPAQASFRYETTSDWGSGFTGSVTITNHGSSALADWSCEFDFDRSIGSIWDAAVVSRTGAHYRIAALSYNRSIAPGASLSFGFCGSPGNVSLPPSHVTINGGAVQPSPTPAPSPAPVPSPTATPSPVPSPTATPSPAPSPAPSPSPTAPPSAGGKRAVAYFVSWGIYDRNYQVTDIPADSVTHINYAFFTIDPAGSTVQLFDPWADTQKVFTGAQDKGFPDQTWDESAQGEAGNLGRLRQLKKIHPHVKTMMSVGGWTLSYLFPPVARADSSRKAFASSCVSLMKRHDFDGIDIDWEYPAASDRASFILLMEELRAQLDARGALDGRHYLLSFAAPAGSANIANLDLPGLARAVDFINVMTYDFHGGWENVTNHHSPLSMNPQDPSAGRHELNTTWTVSAYLSGGVPAEKLGLGVPFYGRAWEGVAAAGNGLFQPGPSLPATNTPGNWEAGMLDYWRIHQLLEASSDYTRYWDSAANAPWLYGKNLSGRAGGGMFVTYEDTESLSGKISLIKSRGLGGIMFWELSGDIKNSGDPHSLIFTIGRQLNQ
ncbi:MAG: glycosyl hydrolase family 18 protein [Candidatus Eremiobacteraeota bacterium]|nr:glycosyl hydrolase family 18 protein [Candidatus Eremiobacteraeota bacterium]